MAARTWYSRLLRIEPGITFGQWLYDRTVNNWDRLIAVFVAGGGMTLLAYITEWARAWGPLGIGAIGLGAALLAWIGFAAAANLRAKAAVRRAEAAAVDQWRQQANEVNPLWPEFQRQRIRIQDLPNPVRKSIENKRFIDCELIGPAILLIDNSRIQDATLANCDIAVFKPGSMIYNYIILKNSTVIGGMIANCLFLVPPAAVPDFRAMGAQFITLTGDNELDEETPNAEGN